MDKNEAASLIYQAEIEFEAKCKGSYLMLTVHDGIIDFWPASELWISRATGKRTYGIQLLIDTHGDPLSE